MFSRYGTFCKVVETGSFTRAGEVLGYSQSAISQTVSALEQELGTTLLTRRRGNVSLTRDGKEFYPFIQSIHNSELALERKALELQGLENSTVRIGTFTSVSRHLLPRLIKEFRSQYPNVHFLLEQGDYTRIENHILAGTVDFGFTSAEASHKLNGQVLYRDEMMAVLPKDHPLAAKESVSLEELSKEPFILVDEGHFSVAVNAFHAHGLEPDIEYRVFDDYTVMAMIQQGLGVSMIYAPVLKGFNKTELAIRPIEDKVYRALTLVWDQWDTMPLAARLFAEYILKRASGSFPF